MPKDSVTLHASSDKRTFYPALLLMKNLSQMEKTNRLNSNDSLRYERMIILPEIGEAGQMALKRGSVAIIGCGALGSASSLYIAGAGIGRMIIADYDTVSLSNLHRQIAYSEKLVGLPKAEQLCKRLSELNSNVCVEAYPEKVGEEIMSRIAAKVDFVIEASDNAATKYMVEKVCRKIGVPVCIGGIEGFRGVVTTVTPGSLSYSDIFPPTASKEQFKGVVGPLPGIIGSIQAVEAIKSIIGIGELLSDRLLSINALTWQIDIIG